MAKKRRKSSAKQTPGLVIRIVGHAGHEPEFEQHVGSYLAGFSCQDGPTFTDDPAKAMRFADFAEAHAYWKQECPGKMKIRDGFYVGSKPHHFFVSKTNRPLCRYSIETVEG